MQKRLIDSGIDWIGKIPEDWKVERLQWHLYEINDKNYPLKTEQILSLTNKKGVIPYEEKGDQGNKSKDNLTEYKLAYKDTIVANSMNILIGSVGYSKYFGCVSPVYYVFNEKRGNDLRFFNYIMQTTQFQKELRKYANGILEIRLRVSASNILKRMVAVPELSVQKRISDFLDNKCKTINDICNNIEQQNEILSKYKESIITEAVIHGINNNSKMVDSGIDYIGSINSNWKLTKLKYICKKLTRKCNMEDKVLICSNSGEVKERDENSFGLSSENNNMFQGVKKGDLLIHGMDTWHGAIAVSSLDGKCTTVVHVCDSKENKRFIAYYLQMLAFKKVYKAISNGVRENTSDFRSWVKAGDIYINLPSKKEQDEIADFIDDKVSSINSIISDNNKKIDILEQYKKSVIYEYVTGKKEVADE